MFENTDEIDTVLFNCGHWDIAHWNGDETALTDLNSYSENIRKIILQLRKLFKNSRIIFITTTPMNPAMPECVNPRTNEEIGEYNKVAIEISNREKIEVFNLNEFVKDWGKEYYKDYCHFTEEGFNNIADKICEYINIEENM